MSNEKEPKASIVIDIILTVVSMIFAILFINKLRGCYKLYVDTSAMMLLGTFISVLVVEIFSHRLNSNINRKRYCRDLAGRRPSRVTLILMDVIYTVAWFKLMSFANSIPCKKSFYSQIAVFVAYFGAASFIIAFVIDVILQFWGTVRYKKRTTASGKKIKIKNRNQDIQKLYKNVEGIVTRIEIVFNSDFRKRHISEFAIVESGLAKKSNEERDKKVLSALNTLLEAAQQEEARLAGDRKNAEQEARRRQKNARRTEQNYHQQQNPFLFMFDDCTNLEEAKKIWHNLAKTFHSDEEGSGSTKKMQELNAAFEIVKNRFS